MSGRSGPKIVDDNLALVLDARNLQSYSGSGNTWLDLSTQKNHCSMLAVNFANGIVSLSNVANPIFPRIVSTLDIAGTDFTLACWARIDSLATEWSALFGHGSSYTSLSGLHVWFEVSSDLLFGLWGGDYYIGAATVGMTVGQWIYLTFTYSNTAPYTRNVYRNAELIGQTSGDQYLGTGRLRIGYPYGEDDPQQGWPSGNKSFSHVSVYKRVLSAEKIRQNFNAHRGRFGV